MSGKALSNILLINTLYGLAASIVFYFLGIFTAIYVFIAHYVGFWFSLLLGAKQTHLNFRQRNPLPLGYDTDNHNDQHAYNKGGFVVNALFVQQDVYRSTDQTSGSV